MIISSLIILYISTAVFNSSQTSATWRPVVIGCGLLAMRRVCMQRVRLLLVASFIRRRMIGNRSASMTSCAVVPECLIWSNKVHDKLNLSRDVSLPFEQHPQHLHHYISTAHSPSLHTHSDRVISPDLSLHWLPVSQRIEFKVAALSYKIRSTSRPAYLHSLL